MLQLQTRPDPCGCKCRSFMARPIFSTDDPNVDKHKLERFLHEKRQCLATIYGPIQYPPLPLLAFRITPDQPPQLALAGILVVLSLHLTCSNSWDVQPSIALHIQCIEYRGLHASNDLHELGIRNACPTCFATVFNQLVLAQALCAAATLTGWC